MVGIICPLVEIGLTEPLNSSPPTNNISELHLRKCTSPMDLEPPLHQGHFVFQICKINSIQSFSVLLNQFICLIIFFFVPSKRFMQERGATFFRDWGWVNECLIIPFLCLANHAGSRCNHFSKCINIWVGYLFRYLGRDKRDTESSAPCKRMKASISDCF